MLTLLKQGKLQRHDIALFVPSIPICEVGLIAGNFILG
jgi:hypothetical protein